MAYKFEAIKLVNENSDRYSKKMEEKKLKNRIKKLINKIGVM